MIVALGAVGVPVDRVERRRLDELVGDETHQGIAVLVDSPREAPESALKDLVREKGTDCFLLILDGVQDPRNLGACLRVADGAGVDAVVVPRDRSARLTPAAIKASSGAAFGVPLVRVTNLARTLRWLRDEGLWVVGADEAGPTGLYEVDWRSPVALCLGGEGRGLRRLTRESCDQLAHIPMSGLVSSLNVSVAAGVVLFEARRCLGL